MSLTTVNINEGSPVQFPDGDLCEIAVRALERKLDTTPDEADLLFWFADCSDTVYVYWFGTHAKMLGEPPQEVIQIDVEGIAEMCDALDPDDDLDAIAELVKKYEEWVASGVLAAINSPKIKTVFEDFVSRRPEFAMGVADSFEGLHYDELTVFWSTGQETLTAESIKKRQKKIYGDWGK